MKILQAFFALFFLLLMSCVYADRPWPGSSPEGLRVARDLKTAIPDLPASVPVYSADGKALGFEVKNPDGIGTFRFGDTCSLINGSVVKFLAPAIPTKEDFDNLETKVYVEYAGTPKSRLDKDIFCPGHAVVVMSLNDYRAFHKIASQAAEEKEYLRKLLKPSKLNRF
jgi:hypothetical protein